MMGLTRPMLFERRSDWGGIDGIHQRVDLNPLDKGSSGLLADELLKKLPEVPAALRDLITSGAEGNPFYMEELVKMLVDEGAIEIGADRWTVNPSRLVATRVPQTLTGVLQARLDGLKPAEKLALQQASIIGVVFWDDALSAIDPRAIDALPALAKRELIVRSRDASFDGVREYAFKHQILHHVTYDMDSNTKIKGRVAPWNKGKLLGQKPPLKLKEIWAIRVRLQLDHRNREPALFNLAIDSKLRGCDLVGLRVHDVVQGSHARDYAPGWPLAASEHRDGAGAAIHDG